MITSPVQKLQLEYLEKKFVVEQFFGRLKTIMGITRIRYPFQIDYMNMDMQICVWLTNQHILQHHLVDQDGRIYANYILSLQANIQQEKLAKKVINVTQVQKKRRLAEENARIMAQVDE